MLGRFAAENVKTDNGMTIWLLQRRVVQQSRMMSTDEFSKEYEELISDVVWCAEWTEVHFFIYDNMALS